MQVAAHEAIADAINIDLPKDTNNFKKIHCPIENGTRVWWYYKEDVEYAEECEENVRDIATYSGIAVSLPGQEYNGSIDEYVIIVIDVEPVEKCYPEIGWVAINRLLDDDELVEIFTR